MVKHNANTLPAGDRISRDLAKRGYNVKVSKPKKGKSKYVVETEGKKKKKGEKGRVRATFKSSVL